MKDIDCALFDIMDYSCVAQKYGEEFLNELDPPQRKTGNQILAEAMNGLVNNMDNNENDDDDNGGGECQQS